MRPNRSVALAFLLGALAVAACRVDSAGPSPYARLDPIVDSLFVGDRIPPPAVTYYDGTGNSVSVSPLQVNWSTTDTTILGVDSLSGRMTGRKRGHAFLLATFQSVQGIALVVVSNTLDLTLLLDTIYLMPNDTLRVPVAVQKKTVPPAPVVWYESTNKGIYTIDSASGLLTAVALGGPVPYIVHADTIADSGAVQVLSLTDTTGGKFFFSVLGSVITHVGGPISAVNYARSDVGLVLPGRVPVVPRARLGSPGWRVRHRLAQPGRGGRRVQPAGFHLRAAPAVGAVVGTESIHHRLLAGRRPARDQADRDGVEWAGDQRDFLVHGAAGRSLHRSPRPAHGAG